VDVGHPQPDGLDEADRKEGAGGLVELGHEAGRVGGKK
jgi:hypothetical protein